ncbi:MAG TPA: transketolase family protein [Thermoplasmata archaeon]|nr:transketolase family protein [Thermoplasmata archaeon]
MTDPRKAYGETLVALGKRNKHIVVLDADLSSSTRTSKFANEFPERFFNMGIAEQNMMATAGGLATTGKIVFASSFAMFATGRVYDQIRQSIAYPELNVKIVATHGGITVGGDGASHQMLEDIALMRVLPNMKVIVPADAAETASAIKVAAETAGPFYIRLGRTKAPRVFPEKHQFELGKAPVLREGDDVTIVAIGLLVSKALNAAKSLEKEGIQARVLNMSSLKPFDKEALLKAAKETNGIVTAEEHSRIGGLGSLVASFLSERHPTLVKLVAIPDVFGQSGEYNELLNLYGLTTTNIVSKCKEILKK